MIVLVGPSASGKTEVAHHLIKKYQMKRVVTCTTRQKRVGEVDGVDYNFLSLETFREKMEKDEFLEVTQYNHNFYGTLKKDVSEEKIIIVDVNGLNHLFYKIPDQITAFYLEAPLDTRTRRMVARGDAPEVIIQKNNYDRNVFQYAMIKHIDYKVDNYNIPAEVTADQIYCLYQKHNK